MSSEHIVDKGAVKAYLLGKIDDTAAAGLEERYFSDRDFFLQVQAVELALIEEYLRGQLSRPDRRRFEERYLVVPELRQRYDEVRRKTGLNAPEAVRSAPIFGWAGGLAVVVLVLAIVVGMWMRTRVPDRVVPHVRPIAKQQGSAPVFSILLSPGLRKGANANGAEFSLPRHAGTVRLSLEFPGHSASFDCSARVYLIGDDSARQQIWESAGAVESAVSNGGQAASFNMPGSALRRGDYIVEARDSSGNVVSTYNFRVIAAP